MCLFDKILFVIREVVISEYLLSEIRDHFSRKRLFVPLALWQGSRIDGRLYFLYFGFFRLQIAPHPRQAPPRIL